MDRNTVTGLVLIGILLLGWSIYLSETAPERQPPPPARDSVSTRSDQGPDTSPSAAGDTALPETARPPADTQARAAASGDTASEDAKAAPLDSAARRADFGRFAPLTEGEQQTLRVQTPHLEVTLANHGRLLQEIILPEFQTHDSLPLPLFPDDAANRFGFTFNHRGKLIHTGDLYYQFLTEDASLEVGKSERKTVRLRAELPGGGALEHRFTFQGEGFGIEYDLVLEGLSKAITDNSLELMAAEDLPQTERTREMIRRTQSVYWQLYDPEDPADGDVDDLGNVSDEPEQETIKTPMKWVSFKNDFFNLTMVADKRFDNGKLLAAPLPPSEGLQHQQATLRMTYNRTRQTDTLGLRLYCGPNDIHHLNDYGLAMEKLVDLGWGPLRYIARGILFIFNLLEQQIQSYGIIILILALFVKLLLTPLTYKSYKSSAKMQVVNNMPEVKEMQEKYKDDPARLNQERMKFYSQVGASPFGGCLPMILQFPILISMFTFFPNSIELRHKSFLWAQDLSSYDDFFRFGAEVPLLGDHLSLFTLLWVISQIAFGVVQQKTQGQAPGAPSFMKYFPFIFPIFLLFIFNSYSSGLTYYYLMFNLITIGQTYITKAFFIDHKKIEDDIHAIKSGKKQAKKGGISTWMEKQQQKQEELQQARREQTGGRQERRQQTRRSGSGTNQQKKRKRKKR